MDVFDWVCKLQETLYDQDEDRVADLMDTLCHAGYHGQYKEAEAAFPGILNFARERRLPWVEVYARHWRLQAHVPKGHQIRECLPEAVALLEFASREEARDCPQSICAVQDLSMCYGQIDGPGYADQRVAVVDETLARIDPSWPCFDCLTQEKAEALIDQGKAVEAVQFIWDQVTRAKNNGRNLVKEEHFLAQVVFPLIKAYLRAGDIEAVFKWCDLSSPNEKNGQMYKRLFYTLAYLRREDWDKVFEHLPSYDQLSKVDGVATLWAEAVHGLAGAGRIENDWSLGLQLKTLFKREYGNGRLRDAFEICAIGARLALGRGAACTVLIHLHYLHRILAELVAPLGADAVAKELEAEARGLRTKSGEGRSLNRDTDEANPERDLDRLLDGADKIDDGVRELLTKLDEPPDIADILLSREPAGRPTSG